jgi:hypothetical protein
MKTEHDTPQAYTEAYRQWVQKVQEAVQQAMLEAQVEQALAIYNAQDAVDRDCRADL